jgi:hypothetical protein
MMNAFDDMASSSSSLSDGVDDQTAAACDAYIANVTALVRLAQLALQSAAAQSRRNVWNASGGLDEYAAAASSKDSSAASRVVWIDWVVTEVLAPAVCLFGAVGNALNLVVLTRRRLRRSMDGLERSVRLGLVALAVSDAMFCIVYLVSVCFRPTGARHMYSPYDGLATLYLSVYHEVIVL